MSGTTLEPKPAKGLQDSRPAWIRSFDGITNADVSIVGGKNASLGEMIGGLKSEGIAVPEGFAITAQAYRDYLKHNRIEEAVAAEMVALKERRQSLDETGRKVRKLIQDGEIPEPLKEAIEEAYRTLSASYGQEQADVAVRSSATAEDLSGASFAGQQETFLNVAGAKELLYTCQRCFASLFTDRAISYRQQLGFDQLSVALSIGIQKMVRSDKGSAGVMSTLDAETGFRDMIVINAAYGLGETVVQGIVSPDEYRVFKPLPGQSGKRPIVEKALGSKMVKMIYGDGWIKRTQTVNTNFKER